jgi:hypothetical protein
MYSFMKTVARCYDAGLSLAALARLGGGIEKSRPRGPVGGQTILARPTLGKCCASRPRWQQDASTAPPRRASAASESPATQHRATVFIQ